MLCVTDGNVVTECACAYRHVVAAVAADHGRLVPVSLQTGGTQHLKALEQTALLLV